MKVIWSEFAVAELKGIFDYYKINAGLFVAQQIRNDVFKSVKLLIKQPQMGQIESYLVDLNHEYRYLLAGNYKIIYYISVKEIHITDIFDCRRNPSEMKENTFK